MPNELDQSFTGTVNQWVAIRYNVTLESLAQQFPPSLSTVKEVTLKLRKTGSPTGNIWVEIWSDTGSDLPNAQVGSDSGTIDVSTISSDAGGVDTTFTFSTEVTVTPSSKYWITVWANYGIDENNNIALGLVNTGGYSGGIPATYNGSTWSSAYPGTGTDYYFLEYGLLEESASISLSPSVSASLSLSLSPSFSPSISVSLSPSLSQSLSPSLSPSISTSLSQSPSPSEGYQDYSRGDYADLPANNDDLETSYSAQDIIDVSTKNNVRVDQTGTQQHMVHQFKNFVENHSRCRLEWEGQTTLAPTSSTVYLQVFNHNTNLWETIDSDSLSNPNTDFILTADVVDVTNYIDISKVISCRVYQLAL